jgi:hypothetical protein
VQQHLTREGRAPSRLLGWQHSRPMPARRRLPEVAALTLFASPPPLPHAPGLFRAVRVVAKPPSGAAAPAFMLPAAGSSGGLQTVAPLGEIEFVAPQRLLPAIQELSMRAEGGLAPPSEEALARARAAAAAAGASAGVGAYLCARAALLEGLPEGVDVVFEGVEAGRPLAVLRPVPAGASALGGPLCLGLGLLCYRLASLCCIVSTASGWM